MPNGEEQEPTEGLSIFEQEIRKVSPEEVAGMGFFERLARALGIVVISAIRGVTEIVIPALITSLKAIFSPVIPSINKSEDQSWDALLEFFRENNIMSPDLAEKMMRFRGLPFPFQSLFNLMITGSWFNNYVGVLSNATLADTVHNLQSEFSPNIPDPNTLIRAAFIAPEKTTEARDALRKLGFSDQRIDLMFIASYQLYDVQTVRDLYFRGKLDKDGVFERMNEMGFTDQRIIEIMDTWKLIPPVQDLITMSVREAFTPEIAERFGQYEDFPEPFAEWAEKQGLSTEWAKRYWASHWQLPSLQMGYEMLHRGVIEPEDLRLLMRAQDVMPFWREKLEKISYAPYTRVDVRRMHEMGVLTDDDLIRTYKDIGYDEEHAAKMAQFTIAYNLDNDKKLTKAQVMKAYRNQIISKDDVNAFLKPYKYNDDQIAWMISMEDFDEVLEIQTIYLSAIQTRFIDGLTDEMQTRSAMGKLNISGPRTDALIEKWKASRKVDYKLPSKTDLDKMLSNKVITKDQYKLEMYRLGYSFNYVEWYLRLIELKKAG